MSGVLYFGCGNDVGHFLYNEARRHIVIPDSVPALDGGYVPHGGRGDWPEGVVRLTRLGDWTILGFRDNSVDSRGGSHSTLLIPGTHDYPEALELARAAFPWVFDRIEARGIVLVEEPAAVPHRVT